MSTINLIKNSDDLATLLRELRHTSGPGGRKMPAYVLAELAGVSKDTVFRVERGEDVSFGTALKLLRVFNIGLGTQALNWPTLNSVSPHYAQLDE